MNVFDFHKKGKIEIYSKYLLKNKKELSLVYTPGVADIAKSIAQDKKLLYKYTIKSNTVAIVTDGSSVLGLGNMGAEAALPVMEGKAMLFKQFADINAFPLCLNTQKSQDIISVVRAISPVFGGINLEDISAPRCFEIEEALQDIGIPVMHDDQHCTAIVVLASLINATRILQKKIDDMKIVINGSGAAGTAIAKLLVCAGYHEKICKSVHDVIVCDSKGILSKKRKNLEKHKQELVRITNKTNRDGSMKNALEGADVFIGVSVGNILYEDIIKTMNKNPIIFALANPTPEIMPEKAKKAGAAIVATGRSDFPNQINNALAFPGVFKGALDSSARKITLEMKLNAAYSLAKTITYPTRSKIIPDIFDKNVVKNISLAVRKCSEE